MTVGFGLWGLVLFLIAGLGGFLGTLWFGRRVWRRRSELSTPLKALAAICALAAVWGALGTLGGVVKAFGAVGGESEDPSQKARILAEGISEAMNCLVFSVLAWIPTAVVLFVLSRNKRATAQRE